MTDYWMSSVGQNSCQRCPPRHGSGAESLTQKKAGVRRMRIGLSVIRDLIVDGTRPHHQAYAASLPWYYPLKDYRGDIRIDEGPNWSRIIWAVTCTSRVPRSPEEISGVEARSLLRAPSGGAGARSRRRRTDAHRRLSHGQARDQCCGTSMSETRTRTPPVESRPKASKNAPASGVVTATLTAS